MKCPRCGFVSFDDLIHCKKCGAQLKESKDQEPEIKYEELEMPSEETYSESAALPPHWRATIQTIKKELEAIEGHAVDKASNTTLSPVTEAACAQCSPAEYNEDGSKPCGSVEKGGFFLRLVAYLIDCAILYSITLTVVLAGFLVMRSAALQGAAADTMTLLRFLLTPYMIASTVIESFYFTYCHAVTGQTIGKWICGLKVVSVDGAVIGFRRAFIRWLGYLISRFFLYAGFLWIAFSREKQGWHDKMAGSYVIKV